MNCFCHTTVTETAFCIQSTIVTRFILLNLMVTVCYANVFGSDSDGDKFPTSMAFLGPDDILVLEKEKGTVQRIVNSKMLPTPVLTVNVATEVERGMLGIAVSKNDSGRMYTFSCILLKQVEVLVTVVLVLMVVVSL